MHYLYIFYLLFPCFAANMAPQIASYLGVLKNFNYPIDFNKSFSGKRIFGDNKTWRGYISAASAAIIIAMLQFILDELRFIRINELSGLIQFAAFGFLSGLGAMLGDSVESFFKRRLNIKSGRPLVPFDQIDYLVGFLFLTGFMISWTWPDIMFILLCGIIFNPIINGLGYIFKIKNTYW